MILDKESLRYGNIVKHINKSDIVSVRKIGDCLTVESYSGGAIYAPIETFEPILITDIILLKCGFIDYTSYKDFSLLVKEDLTIEIGIRGINMDKISLFISDIGVKDINYLHELQNLYYELSDKGDRSIVTEDLINYLLWQE